MFKISIIDNMQVIESILRECDENTRIAWGQEAEQSLGYCAFKTDGEILKVDNRKNMIDMLVRTACNSLDLHGVTRAYCREKKLVKDLIAIGFEPTDDGCEVEIKKFFKHNCRG